MTSAPTLLVEVKGLSGFPRENDTIQIVKYIPRRMKEWERINVSGVVIVNHQCNLPGLEAPSRQGFYGTTGRRCSTPGCNTYYHLGIVQASSHRQEWGWNADAIIPLFYGNGRIAEAPTSYRPVGVIHHFYDKLRVASIEIDPSETLQIGHTVGYVLKDRYYQERIQTLQVDKKDVREASGGQIAAYGTTLSRSELPVGTRRIYCSIALGLIAAGERSPTK